MVKGLKGWGDGVGKGQSWGKGKGVGEGGRKFVVGEGQED